MDAVTYPHEVVKGELTDHWLAIKVDVAERKAVADTFGVSGIPVAVAVNADGAILGSILGFVEPEQFGKQLGDLRQTR